MFRCLLAKQTFAQTVKARGWSSFPVLSSSSEQIIPEQTGGVEHTWDTPPAAPGWEPLLGADQAFPNLPALFFSFSPSTSSGYLNGGISQRVPSSKEI